MKAIRIASLVIASLLLSAIAFASAPPGSGQADHSVSVSKYQKAAPLVTPVIKKTSAIPNSIGNPVREAVGKMVLNVFRPDLGPAAVRDGYRAVLIKPKIDTYERSVTAANHRYRGFGHDHYARADV